MEAVIPWLAVLACPLMIVVCVRMMAGSGKAKDSAAVEQSGQESDQMHQDVAALKEEVAMLRAKSALEPSDTDQRG